jgi:Xaa-Pro aminopeptidase
MAERSLVFPAAEYRARAAALQAEMVKAGLDALLLTGQADITYVTGFLTRFFESPTRPWFVILPATGAPVAVIPAIGAALMARSWVTEIRTWPAPRPADEGISLLADTLAELTGRTARIGLPMGPETVLRMPLADHATLTEKIAPRAFADATALVQRVREIKSEAEIDRIRAACHSADRAFDQVRGFARAGTPLDEVFRRFQVALLEAGADWVSYVAGGAGPGGYADVISPADARPLQRGDVLMLDTGAVVDGYFCDFDRNYAVGPPEPDTARAHAALHAATDAALAALRPGMTAAEAHALMADALRAQGATPIGGRFGHGLGLALTEWPSLQPGDDTVLRAGMVLTLEPGAEVAPGRILVHEENIVLRENGPELLSTRAPGSLPELAQ